jgi:transposase
MAARGGVAMTDFFLLSKAQMRRIEPFFPLSHGVPRVDDRRVISGIVFVIRNGLRWRDAPRAYPLRPMRSHLHVSHLHRRRRHLLAVINES